MILRAPLSECPSCRYPFRGLPTAGRCPECGFHYDEQTIVLFPSKPWRTAIRLVGMEFLLFYLFASSFYNVLGMFVGYDIAATLAFSLVLIIPAITTVIVFLANRRHRFAAVTPKGVVARNLGEEVFIAFDDISIVALRDTPPWIKHRGSNRFIVLRGICDKEDELKVLEEAISHGRSNDWQNVPTSPPSARSILSSGTNPSPDDLPSQPSKSKRTRGSIPTIAGLTLLGTGILLAIASSLIMAKRSVNVFANIGICMFWVGVCLALIGQWRSDPPHK